MIKTSNNQIYIIMYHYVRKIKKSDYPNLKGLEFSDFKKQIKFFKKNFQILSNIEFVEILKKKTIQKKKSVLLTFDDGYKDHYEYVFPFLKKNKISANFYPPIMCIKNKKVLDVNKVHFILEKEKNREKILNNIFFYTKKYLKKGPDQLRLNQINLKSRYDNKKTVLIKRLLQNHLPFYFREKIVDKIFKDIVNEEEVEFSKKLYMSKKNLQELYKNGFTIGSHGYNHFWWEKINKIEQEKEISKSINYFKKIKVLDNNLSVCYPYGSFNSQTLALMKKYKVKYALTTRTGGIDRNNIKNNFAFPRFDTNDFI